MKPVRNEQMKSVSMVRFRRLVNRAADEMIDELEKHNKTQHTSRGVYTVRSLRPRFVAYFRKLLSGEYEVTKQ